VADCAVLEKMGAKVQAHNAGVPVVERDTWHLADGFIFGSGTRFGMMTSRECRAGATDESGVRGWAALLTRSTALYWVPPFCDPLC